MAYLVYVRGHFAPRLEAQVWPVLYPNEAHRVAAKHELTVLDEGMTIDALTKLYPPPEEAPKHERTIVLTGIADTSL